MLVFFDQVAELGIPSGLLFILVLISGSHAVGKLDIYISADLHYLPSAQATLLLIQEYYLVKKGSSNLST